MKTIKTTRRLAFLAAMGAFLGLSPLHAQNIVFSAGAADLTFFYDDVNTSFDVVFRSKTGTVATGLTNSYTPPMGVGGSSSDFRFDSLRIEVSAAQQFTVNGISYFVTPASGTNYSVASQPDLGIRTRFRTVANDPATNLFEEFRVTLNLAASDLPPGAEMILFRPGNLLLGEPTIVISHETAGAAKLTHDWTSWGHTHWHWGFSQPGEYSLAFNFQGLGGSFGPTPEGSVTLDFSVIPEPATTAFLLGTVFLCAALIFRRRSQA